MKKIVFSIALLSWGFFVCAQAPFSAFTVDTTSGCGPLTVQFTNQSSANATSWNWQFPGGTPSSSTAQSPTVIYNTPGNYSVTLTASNSAGSNTATQANYITVNTTPTAGFTSSVSGSTVAFANTSSNATSYSWNFGDGQTSNVTSPSHAYANDGNYTVTLTATNQCGSTTLTKQVIITACVFDPVAITPITAIATGNYTVTVTDANGNTDTATVTVTVSCPPTPGSQYYIFADKNWNSATNSAWVCLGDTLKLTAKEGTQSNSSYLWSPSGKVTKIVNYIAQDTGWHYITCQVSQWAGQYTLYDFWVYVTDCPNVVSTANPEAKIGVSVSPNPTSDHVTVEVENFGNYVFSLYNSLGQLIQQTNGTEKTEIPLDGFASGVYFLRILSNGVQIGDAKKIIKQ